MNIIRKLSNDIKIFEIEQKIKPGGSLLLDQGRSSGDFVFVSSGTTPYSICDLSIQKRGCQVWQGFPKDSAQLAQTGVWILVSLGQYLRTHLKDHTRYDRGPEIHGKPRRVSLPVGEAQLTGCLKVQVGGPLEWDAGIQ